MSHRPGCHMDKELERVSVQAGFRLSLNCSNRQVRLGAMYKESCDMTGGDDE